MSEASRSQVTITLGRTGQVVKRGGAVLDSAFSDLVPLTGTKRSIRDRLGTNVELNSKRRRGNGNILSTSSSDDMDDEAVPLRKDDLRYKIMKKSGKKGTQSGNPLNGVDLRKMLLRQVRPSTTSLGTQQLIHEDKKGRHYIPEKSEVRQLVSEPRGATQHMPEACEIRHQVPDTREVRQRMPDTREARERMPQMREYRERMTEIREVRERMPEMREVRDRMPERREVRDRMPEITEVRRHHMPEPRDDRQRMREPIGANIMRRVPSTRGVVDPVPQIDTLRNSYSSLTLDRSRRRSPDGILGSSRGAYHQGVRTNYEEGH